LVLFQALLSAPNQPWLFQRCAEWSCPAVKPLDERNEV
jgi:hypothetical protein